MGEVGASALDSGSEGRNNGIFRRQQPSQPSNNGISRHQQPSSRPTTGSFVARSGRSRRQRDLEPREAVETRGNGISSPGEPSEFAATGSPAVCRVVFAERSRAPPVCKVLFASRSLAPPVCKVVFGDRSLAPPVCRVVSACRSLAPPVYKVVFAGRPLAHRRRSRTPTREISAAERRFLSPILPPDRRQPAAHFGFTFTLSLRERAAFEPRRLEIRPRIHPLPSGEGGGCRDVGWIFRRIPTEKSGSSPSRRRL